MNIFDEVMKWVDATHNHSVCVVFDKTSDEMTADNEVMLRAELNSLWFNHDPWVNSQAGMVQLATRAAFSNPYGLFVDNVSASGHEDDPIRVFCVSYIEARHERFRKQRMICIKEKEDNPHGREGYIGLGIFAVPSLVIANYERPYPMSCASDVLFVAPHSYKVNGALETGSLRICGPEFNRRIDMSSASTGQHIYCTCFGRGIVRTNGHDEENNAWITTVAFSSFGEPDIVKYIDGTPSTLNGANVKGHFIPTLYFND